jgi:hypothetical protein
VNIITELADPSGRAGYNVRVAAASLLGLRFRIPPGACMSVSFVCCMLSGRGLYDGLNTRTEESYQVCYV